MNRHPTAALHHREIGSIVRWIVAILFLCVMVGWPAASHAQNSPAQTPPAEEMPEEDPTLPKLKERAIPTAEQLLNEPPVDWLVLKTERVIDCDPIIPRPDTLGKMQQRIEESKKWPRPVGKEELQEHLRKRDALFYLEVSVAGDDEFEPDYHLHMKYISQILHHEDLMLKRVDLLLDDGKTREAFELLFVLERDEPKWPGSIDRQNRLLLIEGIAATKRGDPEAALRSLEDLHARAPKFEGLKEALGDAVDALVARLVEASDYPQARHFLERLRKREPQHDVWARWRDELQRRTQALMAEGKSVSAAERHDEAATIAENAARVWPLTPGLLEAHRQLTSRFQRLRVAVVRFPGEPTAFPFPTLADWRQQRLTEAALFELATFDDAARYRSSLIEQWEPTDLGRRIVFSLRQGRAASDPQPLLSAGAVGESVLARLDPASSEYDERLASDVRSVQVRPPFEFDIRFHRVPMKIETLLRFPVREPAGQRVVDVLPDAKAAGDGLSGGSDVDSNRTALRPAPVASDLLSPRFGIYERSDERTAYRRMTPEPNGGSQYHTAEVIETRFPSEEKAIQALLRGDMSFLPHVSPKNVERLRLDNRFFVLPYAVPANHLVQFNPKKRELRSKELRRAMAYAIDRSRLLSDFVLQGAPPERGRLSTAAYPIRSRGYNRVVPQNEHDSTVGRALAIAAKKQLGGKLRELVLVCPPDVTSEGVARAMAQAWTAAGVPVKLATEAPADGKPVDWDLAYRVVRMAEPAADLWPLLTAEDLARVESLGHLPQWLARELLELDLAGDTQTATRLLKKLHEHLQAEVELIPLWEVDEHFVMRKNTRGYPLKPVHPYQNIETWITDAWFPTEPL